MTKIDDPKETSFSDTTIDNDFQTDHMIYKIKNVKKKRMKKNYKNIPVLDNIHDVDTGKEGFRVKEGLDPVFQKDIDTKFAALDNMSAKVESNGITYYGIQDSPEFWDGIEEKETMSGAEDPREALITMLRSFEAAVDKFNYSKAEMICSVLSIDYTNPSNLSKEIDTNILPKPKASDVVLVQKYLSSFESLIMAYFFAYNIIYVTMYKDANKKSIPIPRITSTFFKNLSVKSAESTMGFSYAAKFIVYTCTYALYFSDIMQSILLDILPQFFTTFLNAPAYLIALTIGLFYIIENLVPNAIQLLHDAIMLDFNNPVVTFMYIFVVSMFIFDCFDVIDFSALKYSGRNLISMFTYPITTIVLSFIQFVIAVVISIPIGTFVCLIIFLFYATSIFLYPICARDINLFIRSIAGFMFLPNTFQDINKYLQKSFKTNTGIPEEEKTLLDKFMIVMNMIFVTLYSNIYYLLNIILLSFSIADYSKNIQTSALKGNLIAADSITMALFLALIFANTAANLNNFGNQKETTETENMSEAVDNEEFDGLEYLAKENGYHLANATIMNVLKNTNAAKLGNIAAAYGIDIASAVKLYDLTQEKRLKLTHACKWDDLVKSKGLHFDNITTLIDLAEENGLKQNKLVDLAKEKKMDHENVNKLVDLANTYGFNLANAAKINDIAKENRLDITNACKMDELAKEYGLELADASDFIKRAKTGKFGNLVTVKKSTNKDIASTITTAISNAINPVKNSMPISDPRNSIEENIGSIEETASSFLEKTTKTLSSSGDAMHAVIRAVSTIDPIAIAIGILNIVPNVISFAMFLIYWILLVLDYYLYIYSIPACILSLFSLIGSLILSFISLSIYFILLIIFSIVGMSPGRLTNYIFGFYRPDYFHTRHYENYTTFDLFSLPFRYQYKEYSIVRYLTLGLFYLIASPFFIIGLAIIAPFAIVSGICSIPFVISAFIFLLITGQLFR